ncbi:hypothetical protein B9Z19DRAFT_1060723 [Tuber borchii]|uniref:DDE Tnp4 domain-containing protein n=1 Tax=Tuber borchii TaxID=42251 RepID=A0A2T7A7S8_TUBBO|nr:hypothetical protein B9Z19DRAFT_1060723 [Tuber borchii]
MNMTNDAKKFKEANRQVEEKESDIPSTTGKYKIQKAESQRLGWGQEEDEDIGLDEKEEEGFRNEKTAEQWEELLEKELLNDIEEGRWDEEKGYWNPENYQNAGTDSFREHQVKRTQTLEQTSVEHQLAVFVRRIGSQGMGGSYWDLALEVGIGEGTISLYCDRVLLALLALKSELIIWPSVEERRAHSKCICDASLGVFPGVIGFVDGIFIILNLAPLTDWYSYYNRKSTYGLNAMVPRAKAPEEQIFNATLSSQRVVIENMFGLLKARFPGITNVSIRIRNQVTHKRVVNYFEATFEEEEEERREVPEDIEYAQRHQMMVE